MRTYLISAIFLLSWNQIHGLSSSDLSTLDSALNSVVRGGRVATTVRLAFHDCVGGCNGCLNINNDDNAGLEDLVELLETAYTDNSLSSLVSRADFWAYAGIYAVNKAIEDTNEDCTTDCVSELSDKLVFQTGRVDCDTAPYTDDDVELPGPHLTYDELTSFYDERFGMTAEEAVAIMGAHTLGSASTDNSGFKGAWVQGEARDFNNEYYNILINADWRQREVSDTDEPKWQWNAVATGFMLNSDMCLLKDIDLDEDGESSCTFDSCGDSEGADYVQTFADSQDTWLEKFAEAFTKMQATGDFTLTDLED